MDPRDRPAGIDPSEQEELALLRRQLIKRARLGAILFVLVVGLALGALAITLQIDLQHVTAGPSTLLEAAEKGGLQGALSPLAEVMAAVLGISLTVVAIVVQLASQRYPARIVDLFMFDRINVAVCGFMAASCIYVLLTPTFVASALNPRMTMLLALLLVVLNLGMLLPYFGHVFAFLEPNNIITQIRSRASRSIREAQRKDGLDDERLAYLRDEVAGAIERIADNCTAAIGQADRSLALHTVRTLERLMGDYSAHKGQLHPDWARADQRYFGTLARDFFDEIIRHNAWVEAKTLLEFERIFLKAVREMNSLASQLARSTRVIGERAAKEGDTEVLGLSIRFFNTYLRHAINIRNVRAAYNVLYEYRQLATALIVRQPESCLRVVEHMVYYGRTANATGLAFITVSAAHDVRVICEEAYRSGSFDMETILAKFLRLDQPAESYSAEVALVGVRKAQSILGAFFLKVDQLEHARLIQHDMQYDDIDRLKSIRDEILAVEERRFWEITDRGFNFDYVEPEMRPYIEEFFEPLLDRSKHPFSQTADYTTVTKTSV